MSILLHAYNRLLTDISQARGVLLDPPIDLTMEWVLIRGPELDKELLHVLETSVDMLPYWEFTQRLPDWIKPLWVEFCRCAIVGIRELKPNIKGDDQAWVFLQNVRQLLVFCYKAEFEPSEKQCEEALSQFASTDDVCEAYNNNLRNWVANRKLPLRLSEARKMIGQVIHKIDWLDIEPAHGPGAVFPSCGPADKSKFNTLYRSIQDVYPYDRYLCMLPSFIEDILRLEKHGVILEKDYIECRVQTVPKDSRGPRIICVHPKEAIWIQQGQRRLLERAIANSRLTRSNIVFDDQSINGSLALAASDSGLMFTLDLKEASDRISSELVRVLFGEYAYERMSCARATHCSLGRGKTRLLHKWAPMGNCLTFPVQSLVFWAVIRAGIRCRHGVNCDDIYVFGDDIIAPTQYYQTVIESLVMCGLVPNMAKTFYQGSFRESCGVDAWKGYNVTPFRMRKGSINSVSDAVSLCDLAKRLRIDPLRTCTDKDTNSGYSRCSAWLYAQVRTWLGRKGFKLCLNSNPLVQGLYEYTPDVSAVLREGSFRFNRGLQTVQGMTVLVRGELSHPRRGDWYLLQDSLMRISSMRSCISDRGTEYPVPYRERLSYGWTELPMR